MKNLLISLFILSFCCYMGCNEEEKPIKFKISEADNLTTQEFVSGYWVMVSASDMSDNVIRISQVNKDTTFVVHFDKDMVKFYGKDMDSDKPYVKYVRRSEDPLDMIVPTIVIGDNEETIQIFHDKWTYSLDGQEREYLSFSKMSAFPEYKVVFLLLISEETFQDFLDGKDI